MLLIVTLGLVVASLVLLIIGFVQDHLGYIYISMLCAGVAGVALIVFARLARRRAAVVAGRGVAVPESVPASDVDDTTESVVPAATSRRSQSADPDEIERTGSVAILEPPISSPAFVPPPISRTVPTATGDGWEADAGEDWEDDWGDEVVFPIEDYDDLRVAEILPLIPQLEQDELQEVRDREAAGKNRATILDRIDERLGRKAAGAVPATVKATAAKRGARAGAAPVPAPAKRVTPSSKAAAPDTNATAKKPAAPAKRAAGTRKATVSDTAATVKKAAGTTKSAATRSAAGKSATTKSAPTKATTGRATATKASAIKATGSNSTGRKVAAAAKKATAKKAAGVRKSR